MQLEDKSQTRAENNVDNTGVKPTSSSAGEGTDSRPSKKSYKAKNITVSVIGLLLLLPFLFVDDSARSDYASLFLYLLLPSLVTLFAYTNIRTFVCNHRAKNGHASETPSRDRHINMDINYLAKFVVASGALLLIGNITFLALSGGGMFSGWPLAVFLRLAQVIIPIVMAIILAIMSVAIYREKRITRLAVTAILMFVLVMATNFLLDQPAIHFFLA